MGLIYSNIPELQGSHTETALTNLSELERELEAIVERRAANLSELAEAILYDGEDSDIIKSIILSLKSDGRADSGNLLNQNQPIADQIFSKYSLVERIVLFKEIYGRFNVDGQDQTKLFLLDNSSDVSIQATERIAYMKNSYNDIAYMQFSELLNSPRVAYFQSVSEVCESVYNGECEYCILPIETSADGKLLSFYELILKYNYKINAVYDLQRDSGYTRYALLGKNCNLNGFSQRVKSRNRFIELVLNNSEVIVLDEILSAANFCSLKLRRIDTLNILNAKGVRGSDISIIFRIDGSDFKTFFAYLSIDCPDVNILGIYSQV